MKNYLRFAIMIMTSTIVMFGLMYLNTFRMEHVFFSETRVYMAILLGASMTIIMLSFMWGMYARPRVNIGIFALSFGLFFLSLWLVRSQNTVQDVAYMRAMIPHHSIAILTSQRAAISDPRVRELADEIIAAQKREIAEMKVLIQDIESSGKRRKVSHPANEMLLGPKIPSPDPSAADVHEGFRVEVVLSNLDYATSVEFDGQGNMYVAEAGYSYGGDAPPPRILKISSDGQIQPVANGGQLVGPINDLLWYQGKLFVSHRGRISTIGDSGQIEDVVKGLPSEGDHHNNQLTIGPDGKIYFGQGTATNSGVVGVDNYKMGWLKEHPDFHDHPAKEITIAGRTFESLNPLNSAGEIVSTSSFHPISSFHREVTTVPAAVKANGTIMRMNPDGSELEVYAWGLRNPYGAMWSPDGKLFATENGFDVRGSRPIANDKEDIYVINRDGWYGWPDYAMGLPVTNPRFKPKNKPQPQFVMTDHPDVEQPWLNFPKHSAIAKIEFSKSGPFGEGDMYVAFFGHMSPMTGEAPEHHGGHRVVRIDPDNKSVKTFFGKSHDGRDGHHAESIENGNSTGGRHDSHSSDRQHASGNSTSQHGIESAGPGPRRLLDVRFANDGKALYIADFGTMIVQEKPRPVPGTGVIWRVVPNDAGALSPPAGLKAPD